MFCVYTEVMAQDDTVTFNKTTPHFQLLPMFKVDQSLLRIHEVSPLHYYRTKKYCNTYCTVCICPSVAHQQCTVLFPSLSCGVRFRRVPLW